MAAPPPRKKLRQAAEERGKVATLCFSCRRTEDRTTQQGLSQFFKAASTSASASAPAPRPPYATQGSNPRLADPQAGPLLTRLSLAWDRPSSGGEALLCSKCRRSMEQKVADRTGASHHAGTSRVLPQIARLRQYQRLAAEQKVPFAIAEHAAAAMMREPCTACGAAAPLAGHGLTRLRVWPEGLARPDRGGFMGPYAPANLAAACSTCNLMKGCRSVRGYVEAARHIATHRSENSPPCDFGRYPHRFRNNTSRRSRSCYISASSTHSKTHALSNEAFALLVSRPCRYCGKVS